MKVCVLHHPKRFVQEMRETFVTWIVSVESQRGVVTMAVHMSVQIQTLNQVCNDQLLSQIDI